MLSINKRLQELYLKPLNKWKVRSKSEEGKFHIVEELPSHKLICSCFAGSMGKECRHIRIVKNSKSKFFKPEYGKSN